MKVEPNQGPDEQEMVSHPQNGVRTAGSGLTPSAAWSRNG
jgi:hypothetical protein